MKTMKSKIQKPFLLLMILFPVAFLVVFNIAIRIYLDQSASNQLQTVARTMETTIKLPGNEGDLTSANLDSMLVKLRQALRASKANASIDLLVFRRKQEVLYPKKTENEDFLNDDLIAQIQQKVSSMQKNKVATIQYNMETFYTFAFPITNFTGEKPTVVFVEHMAGADDMVRTMNLILIIIIGIGAIIVVLIGSRLSARIAKPVSNLSKWTQQIGAGDFEVPAQPDGANDILELQALNQSIGEMADKLAAYDKAQKTFLQNASHELKTPLMSIQGYAEGIAKGIVPDVQDAAAIIQSESMRLNTLVDELLTLSRIESHTYAKQLVPINLTDVLKEYAQRLGGFAVKQGRRITLDLPETQVYILADDSLLSRAVMNIVSNCLRYAKANVNVRLAAVDASAVIRIEDDGEGIPSHDLPHIFERFYKGQGGNFGLGLAIAKSAVELLGGSIRAENVSIGAAFEMSFPITMCRKKLYFK
ncbi:MAG: HAMP domain-containing sensor histidine kinase [Eubacteriales bacterium]